MTPPQERDSFVWESGHFRGAAKFSCLECPFYVFHDEPKILAHCRRLNHGREKDGALPIQQYILEQAHLEPRDVIITLGYLCWNTKMASVEGVHALIVEAERLIQLGCKPNIVVLDNGSSDDTHQAIVESLKEIPDYFTSIHNLENEGISRGRNRIINEAMVLESDYLMLMDGDIEMVPLSSYVMTRYLECHTELGCIGAYSSNYTNERTKSARALFEIPESRVRKDINCAWTQYGLFRCEMFKPHAGGIRFDESGVLGQPGWGFEDDDLCFQMIEAGWGNKYFGGMKYLHRNLRSSWPNLRKTGVDIASMFAKRKAYVLDKWKRKGFNPAILRALEIQRIPVEPFQT